MNDSSRPALPTAATAHDVAVGLLVLLTRAVPERRHAPRRDRVAAGRRGTLAAAVRVVDRVHRGAARLRPHAEVALAAGLAHGDVLMVGVADRAHGRAAQLADHPHLAGGQAQRRHAALAGHQLDAGAGAARELSTTAGLELDVVDDGADRDAQQRQRVADGDVGQRARLHRHADLQPVGGQDVGLLAVDVVQQRDVGRPVGVVLDRRDAGGHAVLGALEVDLAIQPLGATAAVAGGLAAVVVAPAGLLEALDEGLLGLGLRDLAEVGVRDEAPAGGGGLGLADRHLALLLEALQALEDRDGVPRAHLDDGLLPRPRAAGGEPAALGLGLDRHRADVDHADVEERLDGLADLRLVRLGVDAERVLVGRGEDVALLADDRADDHLRRLHQSASPLARVVSASSPACEASTALARTMSAMPTLSAGRTDSRSTLRNESAMRSSSMPSTTSTPAGWSQSRKSATASLVDGVSVNGAGSRTASEPREACSDSAQRSAARRSLRLTLNV